MLRLIATWRVAARHGQSNWRILSVLAVGILVAAVLLSSAPIYSRAMADLGLTFTIRDQLAGRAGAQVEFQDMPLGTENAVAQRSAIGARVEERIGWFEEANSRSLQVTRFRAAAPGEEPVEFAPEITFQSYTGYETHIRVLDGELPVDAGPGQPIQFALSAGAAQAAGLTVGDRVDLVEGFDDCERLLPETDPPPFDYPPPCNIAAIVSLTLQGELTAIIEPLDLEDPFWILGANYYLEPRSPLPYPGSGTIIPAFVPEETLLNTFAGYFPSYTALSRWNVFADPEALNRRNFNRARDDIIGLQRDLTPANGFVYGPLRQTLESFDRSAGYQQTPLAILLLEIAAVALFYVLLVASTVVERQSAEITLFRSRGASTWQIASIYLFEGLYIAVPMLIIAPFIAAAMTALLGLTPIFEDVSNGSLLPATVTPVAFGMAAIGALLGVLALVIPVIIVALRGAVAHRRGQSRPGVSFVQRYYLDLMFAALAGLLLFELNERGSAFEPSPTGGVTSDPILLISPALIIAAVAAIILRVYPLVLRVASRAIAMGKAVTVAMSLWQLARSPGQYTRLALLLMMAIAVGTYAASYSSTANRSYNDRANFEAGAAYRAFSSGGNSRITDDSARLEARVNEIPGIESATAVFRAQGAIQTAGTGGQQFQLLAVNPSEAADRLWYRDDFADDSLGQMLSLLAGPSELQGIALPDGTTELAIWVNPPPGAETTTLRARLRDAANENIYVDFNEIGSPGWRELRGPVRKVFGLSPITYPIRLMSFEVFEPPNTRRGAQKPLLFDSISAVSADGELTLVEDFEGVPRWGALPTRNQIADEFAIDTATAQAGAQSGRYTYSAPPSSQGVQGMYVLDQLAPVNAVISRSMANSGGWSVGTVAVVNIQEILVPIVVRDIFELMPTMPSRSGPAIVFNRDQLFGWMDTFSLSPMDQPNEIWFTIEPGAELRPIEQTFFQNPYGLDRVVSREAELARIKANPLIVAGGSGILVVAFLAVLGLVGAAMLVSLWTAVQRRRVEFAILRALGTSQRQVLQVLTIEYAVVVFIGLAGGAYLGLFVARRMLSFLNVTETGLAVEPEFVLQTNWGFVGASFGVVLVIFVAALFLAVRTLSRTTDAQALRTE